MQSAPQFTHWDTASRYMEFRLKLRNLSVVVLFFSVLVLLGAVFLPELKPANIPLIGLGSLLCMLGLLMRTKVHYGLLVLAFIVMIALGGWLIRTAIGIQSSSRESEIIGQVSIALGSIMVLGGIMNLWQNRRYGAYSVTPPPEPMLTWLDSTIAAIKKPPEQAPDIIYFTDDRRSNEKSSIWHGRLDPEKITLVYKYGEEFLFLDRSRFMMRLGPPATMADIKGTVPLALIRNGNKAMITINTYQCEGLTNQLSFDRFVAWHQSGRNSQ